MNLEQALPTFLLESRELLQDMEDALLATGHAGSSTEQVNAIFRAAHTIKGSAGLFGLDELVQFTHIVESVLDRVRDGDLMLDDALASLLLSACDHIGTLVDGLADGQSGNDAAMTQQGALVLAQLQLLLDPAAVPLPPAGPGDDTTERVSVQAGHADHWHISLRFGPDVLRNGMDPLSILRYLATLGTITGIATLPDAIPAPAQMDPESCYLGFEVALNSAADKRTIESAFEFVREDCRIRILAPNSRLAEYVQLLQALPEEPARMGELLLACGTLTRQELDEALATQGNLVQPQRIGSILIEQGSVRPEVVDAALIRQSEVSEKKVLASQAIRVDADKLDQLINLVGELIIAGASVTLLARRTQNTALQEGASRLSNLVEGVRDRALQLRMVKIGATFKRFQRVVHDVSRELGKDIGLLVAGEETELDKTVVDNIGDPLMHLIRNAIDHGIEAAPLRAASGKPAHGIIRLDARHDSGAIVISVSDDGGGLRRDKILEKAIERGLVEPGRSLSDDEVHALVFEPGFSTAAQVSNLSGRGVGMDVVKRNITALRGTVSIHSVEQVGTTVTIRLPLTLAIIDGFLVEIGKSIFAIPLDTIDECMAYPGESGHDYTNLRGRVLPLIRLRGLFKVDGGATRRENIVVLKHGPLRAGLVVDTLLGEFQTVIKPLGRMFSQLKCVSGSTILGSGEVALILDVPALISRCLNDEKRAAAAPLLMEHPPP